MRKLLFLCLLFASCSKDDSSCVECYSRTETIIDSCGIDAYQTFRLYNGVYYRNDSSVIKCEVFN